MEISSRLKTVAMMVDKCQSMADIGTDHAYIPIYLIKNQVCHYAVASDINKGPIEKARTNILYEHLENRIECRLGGGLSTLNPGEVNCVVIAGMGGHLINDIIKDGMAVFKQLRYAVLQPVQNPEALREFIYKSGYNILDEELCYDMGKFYEIIKVSYDTVPREIDSIFYEVGVKLIEKKHRLAKEFINYKISKYSKIYNNLTEETEAAQMRKKVLKAKVEKLKDVLGCL